MVHRAPEMHRKGRRVKVFQQAKLPGLLVGRQERREAEKRREKKVNNTVNNNVNSLVTIRAAKHFQR